ncbi:MAG TPA: energy transducer TonB [Candidatus Aminicenantes bacterium]|nr:energy transducer TonB [Candidatus Aminicenantes bacterium]HRY65805.1 energy transducer TonB [Candidatus Aminicenantes bacterium]HRZ72719.1 energy transducer TonB [Candidatus Aminicenantes bacterium]
MKKTLGILVLGALIGAGAMIASLAAATTEDEAQNPRTTASAFELQMRILEGGRDKPLAPNRPVTSSYLEFLTFANFEDEANVATDEQITKVFNLKDIGLVTEANLVWEKGQAGPAFHMFRINGQEYMVMVAPGRLPERNHFHIQVFEQGPAGKASLLDTEFSLPEKTAAVFGFEDSKLKAYFITLRVARWVGERAGGGPLTGGAASGVPQTGEKIKPPKLVHEVAPVYPEAARKANVEGVVILEATADTYGRVAAVKVLRSIPLLDQAAIDALKQWVYEPMVIDGKPREVTFTVTVRFALDKDKKPAGGVAGGVQGGVVTGVEGGVAGAVGGGVKGATAGTIDHQASKEFDGDAVRAVGDIKPPKLVKQVNPVYPEEARQAGVEGLVIIEAKADEHGKVVDARVLRSAPPFDQAALDAVKQWIYEPLVIDGKPRRVVFTVTVRFALKEKSQAFEKFAQGAVKAEGGVNPPRLIKEVAPVFPETARQAGVEGVVILSVRADETGKVVDAMVLRSIPLLDQAAIDAVRQWIYEPAIVGGKPVPIVFTVTVRFVLE